MTRALLLAPLAACTLYGGGGESPPPRPDPDPAARALFIRDVHPVVMAKCQGCHDSAAPLANPLGFADADPAIAYDLVTGTPAVVGDFTPERSPILALVAAGTHKGITYTAADIGKIAGWLEAELLERGDPQPPPPPPPQQLLSEWSGCMTFGDFQTAGMGPGWRSVPGGCGNCHGNGEFGFVAGGVDDQLFFDLISGDRSQMQLYFTIDLTAVPPKVIVNETTFASVGDAVAPHQDHPRFPLDNAGMAALRDFYDLTRARLLANTCGPPKF